MDHIKESLLFRINIFDAIKLSEGLATTPFDLCSVLCCPEPCRAYSATVKSLLLLLSEVQIYEAHAC